MSLRPIYNWNAYNFFYIHTTYLILKQNFLVQIAISHILLRIDFDFLIFMAVSPFKVHASTEYSILAAHQTMKTWWPHIDVQTLNYYKV